MTIVKQIDPKLGRENQVGLRLRCERAEADAIHRALRLTFPGAISPVLPSYHPGYTFCIYLTATVEMLERRWLEIEGAAQPAAPPAPVNAPIPSSTRSTREGGPTARDNAPVASRGSPAGQATDFRAWERRFKTAVKGMRDDDREAPTTATLATGWRAIETSTALTADQEEDLLLQSGLPAENVLRAQIALYTRSNRREKIVALCQQRRQEVLALPASGLLVEQLLQAHLVEAERTGDEGVAQAGRQIADAFLPELERLRQAGQVRAMLQVRTPRADIASSDLNLSMSEQLQALIRIEPRERLGALRVIQERYPRAAAVQLALAEAHAAVGDMTQALELYHNIPLDDVEARDKAAVRSAEILLGEGRYQEALAVLPERDELPPPLAGLRGTALQASGESRRARPLLEAAWSAGERSPVVALALARVLATAGDLETAAAPYQLLLEVDPDRLSIDDCRVIATIALGGGFGDIPNEQIAEHYDRYVQRAGPLLRNQPDAEEALRLRVEFRRMAEQPAQLLEALADWLDWLAEHNDLTTLSAAMAAMRQFEQEGVISREQRFALLEGIEPFVTHAKDLTQALAGEYVSIAVDELAATLRHAQPLPFFITDLRRALHFLDRASGDMLSAHITQERQALVERNLPVPERESEEETDFSLAGVKLALVGGHAAIRRGVLLTLQERHGLVMYVEVAPSREAHVDRGIVQEHIADSSLIVVITGYMGHDLSGIVRSLERVGALGGRVLWLPKQIRGKSGVIREILSSF